MQIGTYINVLRMRNHLIDGIDYSMIHVNFYRMFQPILIGRLLLYFNTEEQKTTDVEQAYMYAACLTISTLVSMVLYHVPQVNMIHYGMKMRIACCSLIFRKVCLIIKKK